MRVAIGLSRRGLGLTAPNPSVGVVIVRFDGDAPRVVGRGVTAAGGRPHGERIALDQAGDLALGATMYVTLEPCARRSIMRDGPSCTDAILCSGIRRVVIGASDPSPFAAGEGAKRLRAHGIEVVTGVCEADAGRVNLGHALRITRHRPLVSLKLARTADGFAAAADGGPLKITGADADARTHRMRAQSDAIAVGVNTVLRDDPMLTCRLPGLEERSPVRIVFDTHLRTLLTSRIVETAGNTPTWIIAGLDATAAAERRLMLAGVEVMRVEVMRVEVMRVENRGDDREKLDLRQALGLLADRGITRLMLEGGPTLADAFAADDLIDEVTLLTGPISIGAGMPAIGDHLAALLRRMTSDGHIESHKLGADTIERLTIRND
ncbi:MAG: bifunctional diaminohydroxyphosphoribosylaminopyrimidine deaminase/5-amino-6-(5-phosphoribosylamino)uracil reductase RibD [Beijerinckiaceae bacterium]|nr:bifunctional diaminohydroxyphosphoribosylaminopyrimidine deaminase/5-amino-6-(5-phosphoribosylamino)uracil reductase RibD [Beijerinckiaceae bacterium]